ncbi:hypothetical protein EV426DRAFT_576650 [Tirmania nivea]|nr:hypothetical protein EV426DRAFT_576650 [Tirmania nivea]
MSGNISPPNNDTGVNEKHLGIILAVVFLTVIIVSVWYLHPLLDAQLQILWLYLNTECAQTNEFQWPSIHYFLRRHRRLALATNQAGEGGLESNAIAESDTPLINLRDSVLDRIAGVPGSLRSPNTVTPTQNPATPAKAVNVKGGPGGSSATNPTTAAQKRVSWAALPIPARERSITGNGHISGLTAYSLQLDTIPSSPSLATGSHNATHGPPTPSDLGDSFEPWPIPARSPSPFPAPCMEGDFQPGASPATISKKRYSTIPAAAVEAARDSVPSSNGSASKRSSTIKLVGQQEPESPTTEAAKFGGRVVQQKVSGNWVVYDYSPIKDRGTEETI